MKIKIINGPNLNLLGMREPEIYGTKTLQDVQNMCSQEANSLNMQVDFVQSNHEGEIVDYIQNHKSDGIIINAAAYTHTSIAIHDALKSVNVPKIELHISNIYKRENFRKKSYISYVVDAVISGLGTNGYVIAIRALHMML